MLMPCDRVAHQREELQPRKLAQRLQFTQLRQRVVCENQTCQRRQGMCETRVDAGNEVV